MPDLFRREAIQHQSRRLSGDVVLATPLPSAALGAGLVAIVLIALGFATTASYTRKETVPGWISPEGGVIRVAARSGGVVERVLRSEGAILNAGASIATLKLSSDVASGDAGREMARGLAAEAAANRAQTFAVETKLRSQLAELLARRRVLDLELSEARNRADILQRRQTLAEAAVTRGETLIANGFLSRSNMDSLRTTALGAGQDASAARAGVLELQRQIADIGHEIAAVPADVAAQRAQADATSAALGQRRITSLAQSTFLATAPIDGRVVAIPVEPGQTVPVGGTVAVMIPKGAAMTAELYVPSRAAGFIKAGQEVHLMYQAFPYQTFGSARGRIKTVSRTVLTPSEVAIPGLTLQEPVFRVRVALDSQTVSAYGRAIPLQPGMLLNADVVIDRRTLLEWLLDPLYAVGRRA